MNIAYVHIHAPKPIREAHPEYNFMTAEETFVWLSRYKRILCSINKVHHLYFLHRIVYRQNMYTEKCYKMKRKFLLPKSKEKSDISTLLLLLLSLRLVNKNN